ncbi:MAG: DUF3015 family protein [Bdellovibrionales bacterium]|nr:DUF3015 family protein [Bdellovibrionales bacterium]
MMKALIISILVLGTIGAEAQTKKRARPSAYGDAGCGLGSIVFGNEKGAVQIFAATLNATGGNTFAMSFGTSNCRNAFTSYLETNKDAIAKDMARGEGETLAGLLEVMGCQDKAAAGAALQSDYNTIYPNSSVSAEQMETSIQSTLKAKNISCSEV